MLSAVTSGQQARESLLKAAKTLTSDPRLSGIAQASELAERCGSAASNAGESELVSTCRAMAATLAREATNLSKKIQERVHQDPPAEYPRPAAAPAPPALVCPPPPKPLPSALERVTLEHSKEDRDAVVRTLELGLRFAALPGGGVIDTRLSVEWHFLPKGVSQVEAERIAGVGRIGGYSDWRLPTEGELTEVLREGQQGFRETAGLEPDAFVWVSLKRWCWWRFRTEGKAIELASGRGAWRSVHDVNTRAVLVRS
jgi:hypothetical protein